MSVTILNGITELNSFDSYIQANSSTYQFGSAAEALDAYPNLQPVDGYINSSGVQGNVVEFQPNLQGGTTAGVEAVDVAETAGGVSVATGAGTITGVPLIELLGGIFAGLGVGILSYELNKDFWIDISNNLFLNVPGYVPITYDNIEEMSILTLFKDGKTYVDYDLIQATNDYLIQIGAFDSEVIIEPDIPTEVGVVQLEQETLSFSTVQSLLLDVLRKAKEIGLSVGWSNVSDCANQILTGFDTDSLYQLLDWSQVKGVILRLQAVMGYDVLGLYVNIITNTLPAIQMTPMSSSVSGISSDYATSDPTHTQYTIGASHRIDGYVDHFTLNGQSGGTVTSPYIIGMKLTDSLGSNQFWVEASSLNSSIVIIPNIPELPLLPSATPSLTPDSIPTEMPDWWADMLELGAISPTTGAVVGTQYLPVSVPNVSPKLNPVTTPQTQAQTGDVPATNQDPVGNSPKAPFSPNSGFTPPSEPTPTPTPTPAIPIIPAIGGQANKLFTVYNPSQANLDALGATLWTQNIIEQIIQMFTNNPMDAIISLHILYATPTTGANKEIKLGYVPTGVSCPEVTNQYVNVDCGTVRVPELFGDARDYANTDITIYLPMIGFRQLKTEDAMASNISVDYKVDVFTGTVLATVTITKNSVNQVFYTYEGNCAVNLPLTGADKSRQVATAVGAIGAMVTGSPLMALGSATAIAGGSARAQIQRSGNFTGNAGAMGCKKPYIIVSSDVPYDAAGYQTQYGYPANLTVMLGDCSGYVKVKEVHADTISNATEQEKRDIENQLKQGIIIH